MRLARVTIVAIVILGAGAGWFVWTGDKRSATLASASHTSTVAKVPVTIATAQRMDFPVQVAGLGTVQPYTTVTVRSRVDGQIEKIFIREGQLVKQGDLLLRIDPRPYQAALDQANAKRQQDGANLQNAQLDLQRDSKLAKQAFASRQTLDTQVATVNQLQAQLKSDQASIDSAQTQLSYTEIHSPISGRTSFLTVDVGNIVHAADQNGIMTIAQVQPIAVVFTAPEGQLPQIYKAMQGGGVAVKALSPDQSQVLATGELAVINNQVDAATGTIQLKATFPNKDNALWPGLSVDTQLVSELLKNVVVTPEDAVEHGPNGLYAFVVDNQDHAQLRTISVGESGSGKVVVTKGLNPGDRVVVAGQYRLQRGSPVTVSATPTVADVAQEQ